MSVDDVRAGLDGAQPHRPAEDPDTGANSPNDGMQGGRKRRDGGNLFARLGEVVVVARDGAKAVAKIYLQDAWRVVDIDDEKSLARLLRAAALEVEGVLPIERAVNEAVQHLAALALTAPTVKIRHRVAEIEGQAAIALDPANGQKTLFIAKDGVRVEDQAEGVWWAAPQACALPEPDLERRTLPLREQLQTAFEPFTPSISEVDRLLLLAWASFALVEQNTYPVLQMIGGPGSGKTSAARVIHSLVDPHAATLAIPISDARDLPAAANGAHLLSSDNIEALKREENSTRAAFATGASMQARQMHSNASLYVLSRIVRPQSWTAISAQGRADLVERSLIITFDRIVGSEAALSETEIEAKRLEAAPRHFGLLIELVQLCLCLRAKAPPSALKGIRPADLGVWVWAMEQALDLDGVLLSRLRELKSQANAAEGAPPLVEGLISLAKHRGEPVQGSYRELEAEAKNHLSAGAKASGWPNESYQKFGSYMRTAVPIFENEGISVWNGHTAGVERRAVWVLWDSKQTTWTVPEGWRQRSLLCGRVE